MKGGDGRKNENRWNLSAPKAAAEQKLDLFNYLLKMDL